MTLVMDGVRGGGVVRARSRKRSAGSARASQLAAPAAATEVRLSVGMDGLRRPVVEAAVPTDPQLVIVPEEPAPSPAPAEALEVLPQFEPMPQTQRPAPFKSSWKRPALTVAFAISTLVVSAVAVRAIATPRSSTASAEAVAPHTNAAPATRIEHKTGLQPLVSAFGITSGGNFSIVVKDLKTGETASLNPDQQMESASLYKLFVAKRIYQRVDLGQLKYTQPAGGGSGKTIGQCLTVMINISDNTCGRALGDILNWGAQDQALEAEGYTNTDLATPQQTSATDVAKLLERLNAGTLLSPDSTAGFLSLLKDQRVNNRLPTGLPAGTVIAHKTGDLDNFVHDAGIVYGPKTDYLVVVMSGPWTAPAQAPAAFGNLSQQLWNYFEQ